MMEDSSASPSSSTRSASAAGSILAPGSFAPHMSDGESDAETQAAMSELMNLQLKHNRLQIESERKTTKLQDLKEGLKVTVYDVEQEEERLTNAVIRKMNSLSSERDALERHLRDEQRRKTTLESKLVKVRKESDRLQTMLQQEETTIKQRLERQLMAVTEQRETLRAKTDAEMATLQQLQECMDAFQSGPGASAGGLALDSSHMALSWTAGSVAQDTATDTEAEGSIPATPTNQSMVETPANSPVVGALPRSGERELAERSSSGISGTVRENSFRMSTPVVPHLPQAVLNLQPRRGDLNASVASQASGAETPSQRIPSARSAISPDPSPQTDSEMVRLLNREVKRVKALRKEAVERASQYEQRQKQLLDQLNAAVTERDGHRRSADSFRGELERTTTATHEISATSEVMAEFATDRELLTEPPSLSGTRREQRASSVYSVGSESVSVSNTPRQPHVLHGGPISLHRPSHTRTSSTSSSVVRGSEPSVANR